ncbi:MAG: hypothetical protein ACMG55_04270 [Microcoleus sp.]
MVQGIIFLRMLFGDAAHCICSFPSHSAVLSVTKKHLKYHLLLRYKSRESQAKHPIIKGVVL